MNWFLIALSAPALWAVSNHVDKYLLQRYFKVGTFGALLIFATLVDFLFLPAILFFQRDIFNIGFFNAGILMAGGFLEGIAFFLYYYAIEKDEASTVTPLFQIIPVFAYALGFFLLQETLTAQQIIGSLLIILGTIIISLDFRKSKTFFKTWIVLAVFGASFIFALNGAIFKYAALEENYWLSNFWSLLGDVLLALGVFIFFKSYRQEFLKIFRTNAPSVIGINIVNEVITLGGAFLFRYATLLAPLALVSTVNGVQPFFVFIFGVILTLFFPKLGKENLDKKIIAQKILAIIVVFIGTYIINT